MNEEEQRNIENIIKRSILKGDKFFSNRGEVPKNLSKEYTDLVMNLLMKSNKGIAKIDTLVLRENSIHVSIKRFFEIEYSVKTKHSKILEKTERYYILEITESGKRAFELNATYTNFKVPSRFKRFRVWFSKAKKVIGNFMFTSLPKGVKTFLDSAFAKSISYLITLVSITVAFIVNWDKIKDFIDKHF
ncbi:hypothetical protein ACFFLS_06220 [Flavobacterium procerum]|uniref:Uncharacterized protein n=1 Tax=Flavobacterium procerum TaxID=1455569 RepID=A0ABV6BMF1_9FLAO